MKLELELVVKEAASRYDRKGQFKVNTPNDVVRFMDWLTKRPQEDLYVILLSSKNDFMGYYHVARGSLNVAHATPADILRPVIVGGAARMILVHNHPSGDQTPSEDDIAFTKKVREACQLIGIDLLDHIVITRSGYTSMKAEEVISW
ncbi:MAG: JAB domain-containing protein [Candidatus Aenigmatarchaeota archaeon]